MCNGHSKCEAEAKKCDQPCQHNTEGEHCEKCAQGYFGIPVNGGQCEGNIFCYYLNFTVLRFTRNSWENPRGTLGQKPTFYPEITRNLMFENVNFVKSKVP